MHNIYTPQTKESDIPNMSEVEMLDLLESLIIPDETRVESILQTVTSAIWDTVSLYVLVLTDFYLVFN